MKAKLFYVLVIGIVIGVTMTMSYKSSAKAMFDIALENIESMAADEGWVSISRCGKRLSPTSNDAYHYKCESSTNENTIYKCPSSLTRGEINTFEGHYSCYH